MRIYLVARFGRHAEMAEHAELLTLLGHTVTSHWHDGEHTAAYASRDSTPTTAERRSWAMADLVDLRAADTLIAFTEHAGSEHNRGGRHTEFGFALASGKRLMVVGPVENVFYALVDEQYDTWRDLLESRELAPRRTG